jgi:ATP-dependent Lhr-like helicase
LPTALVTTPESLSLMLSRADWRERFAHLSVVVVDEWHELLGSKRGVQVELALARMRSLHPALPFGDCRPRSRTSTAPRPALLGPSRASDARIVRGLEAKTVVIDTIRRRRSSASRGPATSA